MVTAHEKILGETLLKLLIKIKVIREDAQPTGPELVVITEDYLKSAVLTPVMTIKTDGTISYGRPDKLLHRVVKGILPRT